MFQLCMVLLAGNLYKYYLIETINIAYISVSVIN